MKYLFVLLFLFFIYSIVCFVIVKKTVIITEQKEEFIKLLLAGFITFFYTLVLTIISLCMAKVKK